MRMSEWIKKQKRSSLEVSLSSWHALSYKRPDSKTILSWSSTKWSPLGRMGSEAVRWRWPEKSITRASMMLAYWKAKEQAIPVPKSMSRAFGASYLYTIFMCLNVWWTEWPFTIDSTWIILNKSSNCFLKHHFPEKWGINMALWNQRWNKSN